MVLAMMYKPANRESSVTKAQTTSAKRFTWFKSVLLFLKIRGQKLSRKSVKYKRPKTFQTNIEKTQLNSKM